MKVLREEKICVRASVCVMKIYDIVEVKRRKKAYATRAKDYIICVACVNGCPVGAITVK